MPDYEQTASVDAEPDDLFDYVADVNNMPEYLPILNEADATGEQVVVEADIHGATLRAQGWLHVDALERRMEWGAQDGPYHGWLQVDPGDLSGSLVDHPRLPGPRERRRGRPGRGPGEHPPARQGMTM